MKGILIDPFKREVKAVQVAAEGSNIQAIYDAIDAGCFTVVNLPHNDALYLDDEGLFREGQEYFALGMYPHPLAGRGLILGTDEEGRSIDAAGSAAFIAKHVHWLTPQETVAMYREGVAAMHAHAAIGKASEDGFEHIVAAPDIEIDAETGKARAL